MSAWRLLILAALAACCAATASAAGLGQSMAVPMQARKLLLFNPTTNGIQPLPDMSDAFWVSELMSEL